MDSGSRTWAQLMPFVLRIFLTSIFHLISSFLFCFFIFSLKFLQYQPINWVRLWYRNGHIVQVLEIEKTANRNYTGHIEASQSRFLRVCTLFVFLSFHALIFCVTLGSYAYDLQMVFQEQPSCALLLGHFRSSAAASHEAAAKHSGQWLHQSTPDDQQVQWTLCRKETRWTCIRGPCTSMNLHTSGSGAWAIAMSGDNEGSCQGLWACNQQSGGEAVPAPCMPQSCMLAGPPWRPCHMGQSSGTLLGICALGPP